MFRFDMHMLKSHSHYKRNLHNWHQEGKKRKKERKKNKNKKTPRPPKITEDKCQHCHTKDH